MMGDGSLDQRDGNPILAVEMINEEYLHYLDNIFGCLSTGVKLKNDGGVMDHRATEQQLYSIRKNLIGC